MKIALIGYGKMGKAIESIALSKGHEIALRIGVENPEEFTKTNLSGCDVAIEFTSPQSAYDNILKCFDANLPVVCGSTGWYDKLDAVSKICVEKNQAFIYASNFSIGVNIFFEINRKVAELMKEQSNYDVAIEEIHHTQKLDKPSGTALTIANDIINSIKRKTNWLLTTDSNNDSNSLLIDSRRIDNVIGTHTVKYTSQTDEISIEHKAYNREGFARGAFMAAEWIQNRKGFYEMRDLLGIS